MTAPRAFLAVAILAGAAAALLYQASTQRVQVVVAAADLAPGVPIEGGDLVTVGLPPDTVSPDAVRDPAAAVGRFVRAPIWKGQPLVGAALSNAPAAFDGGIALPEGLRAIAVPVTAAQALGGAIRAGARVDVISVTRSVPGSEVTPPELLASAALVLDVRGEQGGAFDDRAPARQAAASLRDRIGSVVLAVSPEAAVWIAERIPTSTFVIALVQP